MTIKWNSPAVVAKIRRGALTGVMRAIGIVDQRAVVLVTQGKKSGRIYRRRGVEHQSSAPGEPFASDTGTTIGRREIVLDAPALRARLIFRGENAQRLELGTRKMEPRPFARRALAETRSQVNDAVFEEVVAELRKRGP